MNECKTQISQSTDRINSLQSEILELEKQISQKLSTNTGAAEPSEDDAAAPKVEDQKHLLVSLGEEEAKYLNEYLKLVKENDEAEQKLVSAGDYAQVKEVVEQYAMNEQLNTELALAQSQNALAFSYVDFEEVE